MDAVIRLKPFEFNEALFAKIKSLLQNTDATEVTISISNAPVNILAEPAAEYWGKIDRSAEDIRNGKGIVFTMEEFEAYINKNFSE